MTTLLEQLSGAVERSELELHFQPEIDLATGRVTAMEALLRWAHPGRGMLWPMDFLPAAEAGGLSPVLDAWVLTNAMNAAAHFAPGTSIWVNASMTDLADPGYPVRVRRILAGAGSCAGAVGIDLPGSALEVLGDRAAHVLGQLRDAGAHLSLELGLSADTTVSGGQLADRLSTLGIEVLKINRAVVRHLDADPERRRALEVLVEAVLAAGVSVTAGGVESWVEVQHLLQIGVTRAHGFLLSPPMRADRIRWALGRSDFGRGSYVQDGSGLVTNSRYASAMHDTLPRAGETPAALRGPALQPPAIRPQPLGRLTGAAVADPFGRHQRLTTLTRP